MNSILRDTPKKRNNSVTFLEVDEHLVATEKDIIIRDLFQTVKENSLLSNMSSDEAFAMTVQRGIVANRG